MKKIILSTLLATSLLLATEADVKKDDTLVTHTEFGYMQTSGNTETQAFSLDTKAKKGWGKNIFELGIDGQYGSDTDAETNDKLDTKNKFVTELSYDYEFTDVLSFNYIVGYKRDKFTTFDSQFYTGPGAKYKAIVSKNHNLTINGNILYAIDEVATAYYVDSNKTEVIEYPNPTDAAALVDPAYTDKYFGYLVAAVYEWQILENLKFGQELSYRGSFEDSNNYFVFSKTGFTSKLSDMFSAGLSYKIDYINIPGVGYEDTDTTLTANLIVDY